MSVSPEDLEAALRRLQTTSGPGDPEWRPLWRTIIRGAAKDTNELKAFARKLFPGDAEALLEGDES